MSPQSRSLTVNNQKKRGSRNDEMVRICSLHRLQNSLIRDHLCLSVDHKPSRHRCLTYQANIFFSLSALPKGQTSLLPPGWRAQHLPSGTIRNGHPTSSLQTVGSFFRSLSIVCGVALLVKRSLKQQFVSLELLLLFLPLVQRSLWLGIWLDFLSFILHMRREILQSLKESLHENA